MNKKIFFSALAVAFLLQASPEIFAQAQPYYLAEIAQTSFLPSEIHAGDTVSLALDIKNRATSISITNLDATIDAGNEFETIQATSSIPAIVSESTKTLVFKFKVKNDTLPGYYPIFLTMVYTRNNEQVTQSQTIFVPVSKTNKNIDVTVEPRVINPGNQTEVIFSLKNLGATPATNISFSWEEENNLILPVGSDNKRYVGILEAGGQENVSYFVAADPNISPGIYPLSIQIEFNDVNGTRSQKSEVGIIIGGTTDFEISAEVLNSTLSLSIANIGSNNASAVVVRIPQQQGIQVTGSRTAILGNLNKGDYTLANFEIQFGDQNNFGTQMQRFRQGTQQGILPQEQQLQQQGQTIQRTETANQLLVEIDYTDTTGQRQSTKKTIQLSQSSSTVGGTANQPRQNNNLFLPLALLIIIVGGAIAFNKFKAKKEWKKLLIFLGIIAALFLTAIFLFNSALIATIVAAIISVGLLAWFFLQKTK